MTFNTLSDKIEKAPKHELGELELECKKAYSGLHPTIDQKRYELLIGMIEDKRRTK